ncbi:hypothetical protein L227DRAFT_116110 [Lentinus tigrinus ALCF2SS1-6]|uniref:Uncharacterized protein n=1 Tax=Lentinus tigrinus ALCF2SS1-6 TaxID=1328759 RepID=A0A5C2S9B0_9APHY|nr:hypothetical protein L227DRAFT_116110 [Lentinus tigrinus ALCF2SS1-6]
MASRRRARDGPWLGLRRVQHKRVAVTQNQQVRTASLWSHALSPRGTLGQGEMLSPPGPWRCEPWTRRAVFLRQASEASWGECFGPRGRTCARRARARRAGEASPWTRSARRHSEPTLTVIPREKTPGPSRNSVPARSFPHPTREDYDVAGGLSASLREATSLAENHRDRYVPAAIFDALDAEEPGCID